MAMNYQYKKMQEIYKKGGKNKEWLVNAEASSIASSFLCRIEEVLEERKKTKKQLAQEIGVHSSYITRIFNDDRLLNFKLLAKMEIVLGIQFETSLKEEVGERHSLSFNDEDFKKDTKLEAFELSTLENKAA